MSERKGTKALELWCKRLVKGCPEVQIDNMTTSWRNGIAFCALVHHFRPDLIDMSKLKPENIYENNRLAFTIAEKHLGIPALLDPEDMVENEVPDRLSVLTYLSQFYQRLGHTVNPKPSENESKLDASSPSPSSAPIKFEKAGLDKCAACGLPVYLAQRLIVSHKLYHRQCFRCSKCSGHLNPKNFDVIEGSDFSCDSCKNEKTLSKFLNNNDQMGMLAFSDDVPIKKVDNTIEEPITPKHRTKPQSILEKISKFENNIEKDTSIDSKLGRLSLKDTSSSKNKEISTLRFVSSTSEAQSEPLGKDETDVDFKSTQETEALNVDNENLLSKSSEKVYKTNMNKYNFLQTQLASEAANFDTNSDDADVMLPRKKTEDCCGALEPKTNDIIDNDKDITQDEFKEESNVTDDIRLAKTNNISCENNTPDVERTNPEISITVPPRKKKVNNSPDKKPDIVIKEDVINQTKSIEYPEDLNPFADDGDEGDTPIKETPKKVSTNPFGSSDDEEDDDVPPIQPAPAVPGCSSSNNPPVKRLISANPFWSDDEEPSSDEETHNDSSKNYNSSMTASTPNLPTSTPRRKKARAPPPPSIKVSDTDLGPATSTDDVASISSLSSYNSTIHSDQLQKSFGKGTPYMKKRPAPTPPDSLSTVSGGAGSMERGVDFADKHNTSDGSRRIKGPAPGLPLPERREVKMQITPEELQVQLDLLETQQLGLERQGVLIEQMIRDKCEGDEPSFVPQEEVEDLVIQLCELVNEKNDLFRKQTELMYIRRQQRLEQEQADIEHEIRVIQSRPAVNRIDADKAREEQLVSRLVQIVRMRDELVQQIDAERRRERQEDLAIAVSIAHKRAQRNSDSNSSSIKSSEIPLAPKKNKVKDKVKKQFKKAKHSLLSKKKHDSKDNKEEDKIEKEKIAK